MLKEKFCLKSGSMDFGKGEADFRLVTSSSILSMLGSLKHMS